MSRIGRKPVKITSGVTLSKEGKRIVAKGPKGTLEMTLRPEIEAKIEGDHVTFEIVQDSREASAFLGTARSLVNNMVAGVSEGFEKKLELVGVGYRAKMNGADAIQLTVGFSHPVDFKLPEGIKGEVIENTTIVLKGIDRQLLGQVAANLRKVKKPEPYKGKGIKYDTEIIRRKQGKSGKV